MVLIRTGVEFILPTDVIIADKFDENADSEVVPVDQIPDGWMVRSLYFLAVMLKPSKSVPCLMGTPLLLLRAITNARSLLD